MFDSSTVSFFVDVFKGAGRNPLDGKKKGGLKIHTQKPLAGFIPDYIHLTAAACNDKTSLGQLNHISQYANGGVISDQVIALKSPEATLEARLIVFKDPASGKTLKFVSNMMDYKASTVIQLYKYRWDIEVVFKQIKQNFELAYFYSDSPEGIKTQIWIALMANLIFTVIYRQAKIPLI